MRTRVVAGVFLASLIFGITAVLRAQDTNPTSPPVQQGAAALQQEDNSVPVYRIQVVAHDIPSINYFHRQGETTIGFQGTGLLPQAAGAAKVKALSGRTEVRAYLTGLTPANSFGPEYLTYVLWAISPEGRAVNLGEMVPSGKKDEDEITVTTDLQSFGLVVTAEPYFAVTVPSDLVVAQNVVVKGKTKGEVEAVNAHYMLLPRGAYAETAGRHEVLHPVTSNERDPLELFEAENAIQIAQAAGATKYAADSMNNAQQALNRAEEYNQSSRGSNRKQTITFAREAVQAAEDARLITIRKIRAEDEAEAQRQREQAEEAAVDAKRAAAERAAEAEQAREQQQQAQEQAAEAEQARRQAQEQAEAAERARQQAQQQAAAAQAQEQQVRERLRQQLNQVLATQETARGLIVNMPDVLFALNKYELKLEAQLALAKISGILLAYPDLKVQVEGYTDSTGSDEYNQKLSEKRADSVKDFLVAQSVPPQEVTAEGFGKSDPVADNSTSSGRAQNRRVELVVSGQSIGIEKGQPSGGGAEATPQQPATPPRSAPGATPSADSPYRGTSDTNNQ